MVEGGIEHFAIIGVLISPNWECQYCKRWTLILDIDGVNLDRVIDSLLGPSITHQTNIGSHWGSKR